MNMNVMYVDGELEILMCWKDTDNETTECSR